MKKLVEKFGVTHLACLTISIALMVIAWVVLLLNYNSMSIDAFSLALMYLVALSVIKIAYSAAGEKMTGELNLESVWDVFISVTIFPFCFFGTLIYIISVSEKEEATA